MTEYLYSKFSAIVPSFNEAGRFEKVVEELLKIKELSELILVDDGSTDGSEQRAKRFLADPRFTCIKHPANQGKGAALRTGLKRATNEVILFLDADLINITAGKIMKIVKPVLNGSVDVSRGSFQLTRGRVTEIAVKPMMKILFPDVYFEQPISGQVCAKKSFLEEVDFVEEWGVDIGLLLEAIQKGQRIVEVDIGEIEHKSRSLEEKAEMAQQVLEMMIRKAGLICNKYKIVLFSLKGPIVDNNNYNLLLKKLGIYKEIKKNKIQFLNKKIDRVTLFRKNAQLFKGIKVDSIKNICDKIPLTQYISEVISALKKRKYRVGIISSAFSPIVNALAERVGADFIRCFEIIDNGKVSGKISKNSRSLLKKETGDSLIRMFNSIKRKEKVGANEIIVVSGNKESEVLLKVGGISVAYRSKSQESRDLATKTINLLPEILAIVE